MNNSLLTFSKNLLGKILSQMADILMPKEKKVKLLEALGPDGLFENIPRAENFDLPGQNRQVDFETDKIKAIFNYKTVLCRQAIWEIKYRANKKLIRDFSLLLYEFILEELSDLETFNNFKNIILIPIPSSKGRLREKGFNQCILITRELIKIDKERKGNNFTLLENFLIKKNDTAHQARVSNRKKRLQNLKNAFSIDPSWAGTILSERLGLPLSAGQGLSLALEGESLSFHNYSFIIIDDVITTGATMNEAFRTLRSAGISSHKIRGYVLAH